MNILVKTAIAGALALGATSAFAALGAPNTNSSDLVLIVQNEATPANVYALDTGISINSVLPTGSLVTGANLSTVISGINQTISESNTLQSFLAANPASGDGWTIEAAQYNGGGTSPSTNSNSKAAGAAKGIFSSALGTQTPSNVAQFALTPAFEGYLNGVNNDAATGGGINALTTTSETSTGVSYSGPAAQKYGLFGASDLQTLGSTAYTLFGLTGNGNTARLQSYILGTASLSTSGVLTLAANPTNPVPLPAAVWLFASGLMGLVGVARRRQTAV